VNRPTRYREVAIAIRYVRTHTPFKLGKRKAVRIEYPEIILVRIRVWTPNSKIRLAIAVIIARRRYITCDSPPNRTCGSSPCQNIMCAQTCRRIIAPPHTEISLAIAVQVAKERDVPTHAERVC